MARTVAQIQSLMNADIQANPILNPGTPNTPGLTSTSKRAIWNLWTFIFATAINLLESLIDIFKAQVEATAAAAAPASAAWLQNQVMLFQYDPVTPQIIQLVNFAPAYPVIDATKQIISRASVTTTVAGQTLIKVATGSPAPGALNTSQLSALQAYVNAIGATLSYVVSSVAADQLYVAAEVYYAGQYAAIIQSTVINAITNLLAALPFNGTLKVSDIELAIRAVPGVNDVQLTSVSARQTSTDFSSGTCLIQNSQVISLNWATVAGYIIPETTMGQTLANSLNFSPQ